MDKDSAEMELGKVEKVLQSWATKICESTNDIISSALGRGSDFTSQGANAIFDDMRDRQSRIITTIQEAHSRQLEMLKTAVAEERKEFSRAQLIFEQSLKTKYDHVVDALQETIRNEHDSRLLRTVKALEAQARLEAEKAKQAFEMEYEVEALLAKRLRGIIVDLRRGWEGEEAQRLRQMEERLRNNYNVLLEHMEAQLKLALQWQEEGERRWLEELEERNERQRESIVLFEEKCRQLYTVKLSEYNDKVNRQIEEYEEKLLEMGSSLASEKSSMESRIKRVKLAASRWKLNYQSELHGKYSSMCEVLEDQYSGEIKQLVKEIEELRSALGEMKAKVESKEREISKLHELYAQGNNPSPGSNNNNNNSAGLSVNTASLSTASTNKIRLELAAKWEEMKTPVAERISMLSALLDSATCSPSTLIVYEQLSNKLQDKVPIMQLLNRRQFLEYKLKLSSRSANDSSAAAATGSAVSSSSLSAAERADLIADLAEVKQQLDKLVKAFEKSHGESFSHPSYSNASAGNQDGGNNSPMKKI